MGRSSTGLRFLALILLPSVWSQSLVNNTFSTINDNCDYTGSWLIGANGTHLTYDPSAKVACQFDGTGLTVWALVCATPMTACPITPSTGNFAIQFDNGPVAQTYQTPSLMGTMSDSESGVMVSAPIPKIEYCA